MGEFGIGQPVPREEDPYLVRGAGRYVNRPAFAPMFDALKRQAERHSPRAVARAA